MRTDEANALKKFQMDTAQHEMSVLRNDGLYRHLRCQQPGTWTYGFNIVTWPGYLAIVGDTGDFMFSRCPDMFEFFEHEDGRISPDYWEGKLQGGGREISKRYSPELFKKRVEEWLAAASADKPADVREFLRLAVRQDILSHDYFHQEEAHQLLQHFSYEGFRIHDFYEWDLEEFDLQYLWCCWAIVWAIKQYRGGGG